MRYYHQRNVIQLMLPKNVPSEIPYQLIALYIIVTINANRHQEKQKKSSLDFPPPPPLGTLTTYRSFRMSIVKSNPNPK